MGQEIRARLPLFISVPENAIQYLRTAVFRQDLKPDILQITAEVVPAGLKRSQPAHWPIP
jgi:hypothetical protein